MDRFNTHVISAILNIGQKVVEEWPLYILDNEGAKHSVVLEAGEMLLYESARVVHGRPQALVGEYYDNLFIHYRPSGDWYSRPFIVGTRPRARPVSLQMLMEEGR